MGTVGGLIAGAVGANLVENFAEKSVSHPQIITRKRD